MTSTTLKATQKKLSAAKKKLLAAKKRVVKLTRRVTALRSRHNVPGRMTAYRNLGDVMKLPHMHKYFTVMKTKTGSRRVRPRATVWRKKAPRYAALLKAGKKPYGMFLTTRGGLVKRHVMKKAKKGYRWVLAKK